MLLKPTSTTQCLRENIEGKPEENVNIHIRSKQCTESCKRYVLKVNTVERFNGYKLETRFLHTYSLA